jgi:hypothetical protein
MSQEVTLITDIGDLGVSRVSAVLLAVPFPIISRIVAMIWVLLDLGFILR